MDRPAQAVSEVRRHNPFGETEAPMPDPPEERTPAADTAEPLKPAALHDAIAPRRIPYAYVARVVAAIWICAATLYVFTQLEIESRERAAVVVLAALGTF